MQLSPEEKTILGGLSGLIAAGGAVFAMVKKWFSLTSRVDRCEKRIGAAEKRISTPEGESRLLSIKAFERINAEIKRLAGEREKIVTLRLDQHEKRMEQMGEDISDIKDALAEIKADIAVLVGARKTGGRRQYDG